jgi:hypothetical protein
LFILVWCFLLPFFCFTHSYSVASPTSAHTRGSVCTVIPFSACTISKAPFCFSFSFSCKYYTTLHISPYSAGRGKVGLGSNLAGGWAFFAFYFILVFVIFLPPTSIIYTPLFKIIFPFQCGEGVLNYLCFSHWFFLLHGRVVQYTYSLTDGHKISLA